MSLINSQVIHYYKSLFSLDIQKQQHNRLLNNLYINNPNTVQRFHISINFKDFPIPHLMNFGYINLIMDGMVKFYLLFCSTFQVYLIGERKPKWHGYRRNFCIFLKGEVERYTTCIRCENWT